MSFAFTKDKVLKYTNYNFAYSFVRAWNLVSDIKGRTETEGIWEKGAQDNIWTEEGLK
jgi:hypothetical protein